MNTNFADIRYCWMIQNLITRTGQTEQMTICLSSQAVVKKHKSRSPACNLPTTLWSDFMLLHKITTPKATQSILTPFKNSGLEILKCKKTRWCLKHTGSLLERVLRGRGVGRSIGTGFWGQTAVIHRLSSYWDILRHIFILRIISSWGGMDRRLWADDTVNK